MPNPKDCQHDNTTWKRSGASVDVCCIDCKLSVTQSQMRLTTVFFHKLDALNNRDQRVVRSGLQENEAV